MTDLPATPTPPPAATDDAVAITGASRGIGAATARRLAARGARVLLSGRDRAALDEVVAQVARDGGTAIACPGDVTHPGDLAALVAEAVERFGRLDVLVANAGVASVAPLAEGTIADWDAMIDVNLRGVLHGIAAALPVFTEQGSGHFVTVTSTSSLRWLPGQGVYAATKTAVRALCDILRQEVGPEIRVTTVCPGATDTDFGGVDAETRARLEGMRMAPEAVAEAIAFALDRPTDIDVGEIVVRSARQP